MASGSPKNELPVALQRLTLSFLSFDELARVRRVSRSWKGAMEHETQRMERLALEEHWQQLGALDLASRYCHCLRCPQLGLSSSSC